jgi:uncharacterized membrane protein YeaQ/YmgE (transglycosylase-associated protein family)
MNNLMDLGGGVGPLWTVIIGGLAGWIAEKITRSDMGIFMNVIVGIIGAFLGEWLANALNLRIDQFLPGWFSGNLLVAAVGAVIVIYVFRLFRTKST